MAPGRSVTRPGSRMTYSVCSPRALLLVALARCATASARYHPRVVVTTDPACAHTRTKCPAGGLDVA